MKRGRRCGVAGTGRGKRTTTSFARPDYHGRPVPHKPRSSNQEVGAMCKPLSPESINAAKTIGIVLVPVPPERAGDDRYSAEMCPQPADLILDLDLRPRRERRCVKNQPPLPRRVLPASPRRRERRSGQRHGGSSSQRSPPDSGDPDPPSRLGARVLERERGRATP